jgi:hypothetical protein
MTSIFTKAAVAAVLALSTLATIPAVASAQDARIHIGVTGPGDNHDQRMDNRHDNHYRPRPDRRDFRVSCSSGQAVEKAARTGLRDAHVVRRDGGRVIVEGRRHHRLDRIVFANTRGCPIIR